MYSTIEQVAAQIKQDNLYLIGICGIPGSGKSHFAQKLQQLLDHSIIVPMDGFHLYRKDLTPEGMRFRGAAFTFDLQQFKAKIEQLSARTTYPMLFPSFDHALKDPL
jgi:pantothenate kinase